jgi:predicted acylesterase/phospholipase RssA
MKGGTTSGVIYPLAVCQIARRFRLRNVGGASAGAIAAAAAAAAEIGRDAPVPAKAPEVGHVRPGFVGLADLVANLTQLDEPEAKDRFRLAQLFRPAAASKPVYRLLVAAMRRRFGAIPVLLVGAFGRVSKFATGLLIVGAVLLVGASARSGGQWSTAREGLWTQPFSLPDWGLAVLLGLAGIVGAGAVLVGVGLLVASGLKREKRAPDAPAEPTPENLGPHQRTVAGTTAARTTRNGLRGLLVAGGAALVGVAIAGFGVNWWVLLAAVAWLLLGLLAVLVASTLYFALGAKGSGFGLIAGASKAGSRGPLDLLAGVPFADDKRDDPRPLTPWLSETFSELAGLSTDVVLRFGHLWCGRDYEAGRRATVESPDRRVNLELITSELVHGRSYKFPLEVSKAPVDDPDGSGLFVRKSDLEGGGDPLLPANVIKALTAGARTVGVYDSASGEKIDDLYALPDPADLPVAFAVRLSMPFPALFRAVRLYRLTRPLTVRDELGRPLPLNGVPITFPGTELQRWWAEELWFSDGGITSNFPAHLFDSLLPRWPTFGINLDSYPPGYGNQDVWLPHDWQVRPRFGGPIRHGLVGFLLAIVDTARTWRDNAQMAMPSYRGRIASVRQQPSEGGSNLFMTRETIAALAVRGSFAGTLLRRRFSDKSRWERHQWLRFRGSVYNLEQTGDRTRQAVRAGLYSRLLESDTAAGAFDEVRSSLADEAVNPWERPPGDDWYLPGVGYWRVVTGLIERLAADPGVQPDPNVPRPAPDLRQVPSA